jgi:hypothetical protein
LAGVTDRPLREVRSSTRGRPPVVRGQKWNERFRFAFPGTTNDANVYAEGVRRGGTLVTAHVDDQRVSQAREILQRSRSVDLVARRNAYREAGWSRFDEAAPAYTDEQVRRERQLYS